MPTTTVDDANCKWGVIHQTNSPSVITNTYTSLANSNLQAVKDSTYASWINFTGITIPKGSKINSATLNLNLCSNGGTDDMGIGLANDSAPVSPPPSWSGLIGALPRLGFTAITISQSTTKIVDDNTTWAIQSAPSAGAYGPYATVWTQHVQALVTSFDYSNDNMMFYLTEGSGSGTEFIYPSGRGLTKDPELVINYLVLIDKTTYVFI